ncbi:diphosphate--fructose-6-phosphate 1-phosphotransferase [Mycolicibacterium sp. 050232]|uniref:diphosphate--fructose-6-phosphate 1-phosphotransferase n=1 Tax=Mycolicibacterium sp. 050232 TaxID=3113982 RepID=UPI002E28FEB8|nr:diphosphate--fructose-6-phosphate 1-phosphotransferase [Mycolicibacterium sp. 050232]MED5812523.1 diphosphate--fructose-6-phosphate 1-phosphotransferase [Mycolicibacterium sp. 050232]
MVGNDPSDTMVTYRYVRVGLVALVVFLLTSLALTWAHSCPQGSISAFFYTRTHAVFLASLCAIGICLIAYKGSRIGEDALLNYSGFMAFIVALVPTGPADDLCQPWLPTVADPFGGVANNVAALFVAVAVGTGMYLALNRWRTPQQAPVASEPSCAEAASPWKTIATALLRVEKWLPAALLAIAIAGAPLMLWDWFAQHAHVIAAVAMFLAITLVAVYHACYARAAVRRHLARFYATIAALMLVTVVAGVVLLILGWHFGVITVELILTVLFAVFWAVQTWDVWDAQDRYPAEAVPTLADTPT